MPYLQLGNNPDTIVNDEKIDGGPSNADGVYAGQMTLRTAVSKSKNTVAWKIYRDDITPKAGIGFLLNMGFHKIWMDKSTNAAALGGFTLAYRQRRWLVHMQQSSMMANTDSQPVLRRYLTHQEKRL